MKFGQRLRREAVPEWSDWYVDYDGLKRAIDEKDTCVAEKEFLRVLETSLEKAGGFFASKMEQLEAKFNDTVQMTERTSTDPAHDPSEIYLEGLEMRRFAMVNSLAVIKAVKKWNKNHPERPQKAMPMLQGQPFFNSSALTHLLAEIELHLIDQCPSNGDLHEELVCPVCLDLLQNPVVFDCAHRFCWDCAVNHAINEVKATSAVDLEDESRISCHCPVCRKPQVLGLDELPIDEDLEEVIQKNFGRSAGLDSRSVAIPITIRERLKYSKSISELNTLVDQTEAAEKQRQVWQEQWGKVLAGVESSSGQKSVQANLGKIDQQMEQTHRDKALDVQAQVEALMKKIEKEGALQPSVSLKRRWSPPPRHENMFGAKEENGVAVVGHRGDGANRSSAMCNAEVRENTLAAFEKAAMNGADFVELDVQLTKDGVPVIWHDDRLFFRRNGVIEKYRISEIDLAELRSLQSDVVLMRDFKANGHAREVSEHLEDWLCGNESAVPTLEDVLTKIPTCIGLNLEIKFLEENPTNRAERDRMHEALINTLLEHAEDRRIVLSSFDPDSAIELRAYQLPYPVFMLTERGDHPDPRRNSLAAALMVAIGAGLDGVACEVAQLLDEAREIGKYMAVAKRAGLKIVTFGSSTDPDALARILKLGVCAVITDHIQFTRENLVQTLPNTIAA